ncbi:hypothetical protein [Streptomyces sp. NPDC005262]|uniref:hypothetical protein n=1 Tax=Streptomyces sp. NPDC005262 TaxID=3364710 RepID=UPI00368D6E51
MLSPASIAGQPSGNGKPFPTLPPDKTDSPLAHRPYDLRHTCITNWLNAGVPVAEVSRRAGNSPEVVHRRYAGCIDGHEELNNRKIEMSMGWVEEISE